MKSLLIEFLRFNKLDIGSLRAGDPYLIAAGTHPVRNFEMPLDQVNLLDLMRGLRYEEGTAARTAALQEVSEAVTSIFRAAHLQELETGEFPLLLDLIVNAAELAALPFEMITDSAGQPLLVRGQRPVELTRRVRHEFAETPVRWPIKPRILFAWACPPGVGKVPQQEHEDALRAALKPWIPMQEGAATDMLTILPNSSVASLEKKCAESAKQEPFTHIHILAHGYPVGRDHRKQFGIAFHDEAGDLDAITPEAFTDALAPLRDRPVVVTLATCDAANMINAHLPEKSIAHQLHVSGFPVVVASQLPFTVPGSTLMVERFYSSLLEGRDVREALHEARIALYKDRDRSGHDWASLVGYVRLPEGYEVRRLEAVLSSLKFAQAWSDRLVTSGCIDPAQFDDVAEHLRGCIEDLTLFLMDPNKPKKRGIVEENLGLLGSAEKRLAELHFTCDKWIPGERKPQMRDALERSHKWYQQAYESNLSHHWTGVQYLALESVLEGKIVNPGCWHAAMTAAEIDCRMPNDYWAPGSLAELWLLAPMAGQPWHAETAIAILEEMKIRVMDHAGGDRFPLESTERQLRRYVDWWTTENGFFPGRSDLAAEAGRLIAALQAP